MKAFDFHKLINWKQSACLTLLIYRWHFLSENPDFYYFQLNIFSSQKWRKLGVSIFKGKKEKNLSSE